MADFVEIISQQEIANIKAADAALNGLLKTLNVTVATANKLNVSGTASSKPSQVNNNTAASNAAIERNIRAIERQRVAELKLQAQREKAFDQYERQLTKETSNLERSNSVYTKIQTKVTQLTATYNNLAAKKELGIRLTDRETAQLSSLEGRLQKYQQVLSKVDQNVGNYRRNVGNYASGFNPLNNAIGQLAREAPNAAQSFQIFAMSISNNIGALQDSISQLRAVNAQLVAQGQPVRSVFSQVLSSVLSLNTAFYIGIAVFIAYSKEISTFFNTLFSGAKALDVIKESSKQLNDIRVSSLKSITQERTELQNNLGVARDTTLSYKDREIAAQKVLDQYPYWFESLGKEAIMNGDVQAAIEGVNRALLARALANAAVGKITENQSKFIDLEEQRLSQLDKLGKAEENLRAIRRRTYAASESEQGFEAEQNALARIASLQKSITGIVAEQISLNEINNRLANYSLEQSKEAIGLDYKTEEQSKKAAEGRIQAETNSREAFERTISSLEERLSLINQENASYGFLQGQLNLVKGAYEALYGAQKDNNEESEKAIKYGTVEYYTDVINRLSKERDALADSTEEYALYSRMIQRSQEELDKLIGKEKGLKKLNDEVQKYLRGFTEGFLNEAKLGSLNLFLQVDENGQSQFEKLLEQADTVQERFQVAFTAIAQVAQETFAFIQQNNKAKFDAMYAELEREKDLSLQFAGESEAGRAEIERQYDEKRREIRNKEAKSQKDQALFNAIINTAQAVVAALPNIPLSVIVGALGAAQIALIASRPIPQFKEGVQNFGGGLAVVGDGGRSEIIQTPSGGLFKTPSTDTLVDLPRGANVFKSEIDFLRNSGVLLGGVPHIDQERRSSLTEGQLERVMMKTLAKMPQVGMQFDKSGYNAYVVANGSKTNMLNNRVTIKPGRVK